MKTSPLKLNLYVRYVNVFAVLLWLSSAPMPVNKYALAWCSGIGLAANFFVHLFYLSTRRLVDANYALLVVDVITMGPAIYVTGFVASPFLLVLPLTLYTSFFVKNDVRFTIRFGLLWIILLSGMFAIWWWRNPAVAGWHPRDYPVFTIAVFVMQILMYRTMVFQNETFPDPLVQELGRQETALANARHKIELGTAVSMVVHEIRNPLTTIKLAVELSRNAAGKSGADGKATVARHLKSASAEIARTERMLESVLSYAREKQDRLKPAPTRVRDLVDRAAEFINMKYGRSASPRFVRSTDENGFVNVDPDAMHQVLVNLLDNSVQARVEGRHLEIEVRMILAPRHAVLTLRDNGQGIPAGNQEHLFKRFATFKEGGTGLGLPIARQIIEKHGGTIELHSTEGAGTTAVIKLPLAARAKSVGGIGDRPKRRKK